MHLSARVATYIDQETLLDPGQRLVVGVSGGPDSLCLLDCLIRLDFHPVVAHFDHQLREESSEEAEFVSQLADAYGIPFELGQGQVRSEKQSLEEAARLHRYQFLASVAMKNAIEKIAVGHTANDQAETVLMHLIRGAGSAGLRGMLPVTDLGEWVGVPDAEGVSLVRPLLEVWRHETEAYCTEHELEARSDPSNMDPRFFRNRLRNELLPELQMYNPRIQEVLLRTAKVMAADAEAIDELVEANWSDWVTFVGEGVLKLHADLLSKAPLALQRAAMRRAILLLIPGMRDVGFDTVERALQTMREGGRLTLLGGLDLLTVNGNAYLRLPEAAIVLPGVPQLITGGIESIQIPFQLALQSGWELVGTEVEPGGEIPTGTHEAWFDAADFRGELTIRSPRPGDHIAPIGMSGSVKLSDLFVNRKVPWPARERWPVFTLDEEILWVPGLHRSKRGKVTPSTRQIVQLLLLTPSDVGD
jgi:tRNA(Ile)-lysidine synthase